MTESPQPTLRWKAADINKPGYEWEDHIADTPIEKVYEWVKTGHWNQSNFKRWLKILRVTS